LQLGSIAAAAALPNLLAGFQLAGRESSIIREYFEPRQKKQFLHCFPCLRSLAGAVEWQKEEGEKRRKNGGKNEHCSSSSSRK
jgi:hypothetical protein